MSRLQDLLRQACGMRLLAVTVVLVMPPWGAGLVLADPVGRLHRTVAQSVDTWRRSAFVAANTPLSPTEQEIRLAQEIRLVVAPTPKPLLRAQSRLEGHTLIVSAGWLALMDDLLRAEALYGEKSDCMEAFVQTLNDAPSKASLAGASVAVWPRLETWLSTHENCRRGTKYPLQRPSVQAKVDQDVAAVTVGLLSSQVAEQAGRRPAPAPRPPGPRTNAPGFAAQITPVAWRSPARRADDVLAGYALQMPAVWCRLASLAHRFDDETRQVMSAWAPCARSCGPSTLLAPLVMANLGWPPITPTSFRRPILGFTP